MTEILLVGDIHISDKPPSSATDTYTDDIIAMLRWIGEEAQRRGVTTIVWAGDIFHFKQPSRTSHSTVLKMLGVVQYYRELGIELWIVIGNHDISNDVLETVYDKQPLGVLLHGGANELSGWHPTLPLLGVPWQQRWHHEGVVAEAFAEWRDDRTVPRRQEHSLAVTHAPIIPPADDKELYETLSVDEIAESMAHAGYLYYGHIHEDHGIWEHGGVTFANMGALSRGSLTEYNVNREIKIASWTPEDGFTEVPVPHKPASEVLRIKEVLEKKEEKLSLDQFLSEVGSSTLDISTTESVISHIRALDVPKEVKEKSIELLENVK